MPDSHRDAKAVKLLRHYLHSHEKGLLALRHSARCSNHPRGCLRAAFLRVGQHRLLFRRRRCFVSFFFVCCVAKRLVAEKTDFSGCAFSFGFGRFVVCRFFVGRVSHHVPVVLKCIVGSRCAVLPICLHCESKNGDSKNHFSIK